MEESGPISVQQVASVPLGALRECSACGEKKPFDTKHWYADRKKGDYRPRGTRCAACFRKRAKAADRADKAAKAVKKAVMKDAGYGAGLAARIPTVPSGRDPAAVDPASLRTAMGQGLGAINDYAADLLAMVMSYALDPTSPEHTWALKLMTERVMPAKMFAELGLNAAGILKGGKQQTRSVSIVVKETGAKDGESDRAGREEPVGRVHGGEGVEPAGADPAGAGDPGGEGVGPAGADPAGAGDPGGQDHARLGEPVRGEAGGTIPELPAAGAATLDDLL